MSDPVFEAALKAAVEAVPPAAQAVEVIGETPLGLRLRERYGAAVPPREGPSPEVVIETTGQHAEIQAALARVADLGTVVLAGPMVAAPVALDLYPDLHYRGLTVVGLLPLAAKQGG